MKKQALTLTTRLQLAPGASLLRILLRDMASGALGSVSIPLSRVLPGRGNWLSRLSTLQAGTMPG
jgi:hypothetical protein